MNQENARNTIQKEQTDTLLCEDADTSIEFDIFPMSFAQRRMWFFYQLNPHDPAYNVPLAIRLTGRLQKDVLERCINDLIERHEGLRTVFKLEDDQPVQVIWPSLTIPLAVIDAYGLSKSEVYQCLAHEAQIPFDLVTGPVIKTTLFLLDEQEYIFLLNCHHIAIDGWALGVFYRELQILYNAYVEGKPSQLPELSIAYADFTQWQLQNLQGAYLDKLLHYWKTHLGGELSRVQLPLDRPRVDIPVAHGARQFWVLPPHVTAKLKLLCHQSGTTLFMVLLAAYQTLLYRYSNQDNIIVGSPIANRNRIELEGIIGFFANTLALRVDFSGDLTFLALLERVREVTLGAYAHQDLPFERLVEELQPERDPRYNPIFQHIFALQKPPEIDGKFQGLRAQLFEHQSNLIKFDLELITWESGDALSGFLNYNTALFDDKTISKIVQHWLTLVEQIASNPSRHLSELTLMAPEERLQVMVEMQPAPIKLDAGLSITQYFEQQVVRTPDAQALLSQALTLHYYELNQKVNRLAHYLRSLGVGPDVPVGLYVDHSIDEVVGLLAILKAGGTCVLIDPTNPPARLAFIIEDAQISVLLTQGQLLHSLPQQPPILSVLCINREDLFPAQQHEETNPSIVVNTGNIAYIVYPSTKGVLVEHGVLQNHLQWWQETFTPSAEDTIMLSALPGCAQTVWEILSSLLCGARLIIPDVQGQDALAHLIHEQNVTILHTTPTALATYAGTVATMPASSPLLLRLVLCYGEQLPWATVNALSLHFKGQLYLLYSLPEAATCIATTSLSLPINAPAPATDSTLHAHTPTHIGLYVLDSQQQPLPIGLFGEIYLVGDSLSRPYQKDEGGQRFLLNPFTAREHLSTYIFRTGKYGRFLHDGRIALLKSLDRQVDFNGHEISLSYIEEALLKNPSINDCRVTVRSTEAGTQELVGYIVPQQGFTAESLKSHMQSLLPSVMVPHLYVPVTVLPLTSNGEVDEQALLSLEVIDHNLLRRWEECLQTLPEIDQVVVCTQEDDGDDPPLHLSNLLFDWEKSFKYRETSVFTQAENSVTGATSPLEDSSERRLALSSGAELVLEPGAPTTLTEMLYRSASEVPTQKIVYVQHEVAETSHTYATLLEEAERVLTGLRRKRLKPQEKILFQLDLNQDFIAAFWGCVLGGWIPVPLSIAPTYGQLNSAVSKLQNAWSGLDHPVVLAGHALIEPLRIMAEEAHLPGFDVLDIAELRANPPDHSWHQSKVDDVALMLLTSGSTGAPKSVMLTHANIVQRTAATIQMNHFSRASIQLNWMPLDHVGGIVMYHLLATYLGSKQIHVHTQTILQDPLKWLDLIERYRVTDTWAPNFAYGLVNACAEEIAQRHWDLSSLSFLLNGGEAVVAQTASRFLELLQPHGLPATAMHPAWGMSETSSGVTFSHNFTLEHSAAQTIVEVGAPIPGTFIRIVDANDQTVTEGTTGHLQIKGLTVTNGYYQRPDLNQEVFTPDGWFNTGDLGIIKNGNLAITGRAKDTIIVNGMNIYSHDVEALVEELEHIDISYTAACPVGGNESGTNRLALFFVTPLTDEQQRLGLIKQIRGQVNLRLGINVDFIIPVAREDIPKTAINKIQRSLLRERFEHGDFAHILKHIDIVTKQPLRTVPAWFYEKKWIRKQGGVITRNVAGAPILLFLDQHGLGKQLLKEFSSHKQACICVEPGTAFVRVHANHYCIDPHSAEDYRQLVTCLRENGQQPDRIIHLWTYGTETHTHFKSAPDIASLREAQYSGTYSLLFLLQALATDRENEAILHCYVVSSHMHTLAPVSTINVAAASLGGFLKTVMLELPWVQCHSIYLETDSVAENAAHLLYECSVAQKDTEVAYREGKRLVSTLEKVDLTKSVARPVPLQERGLYLITGGLGGIGAFLTSYLLKQYHARIIIVGKTPLPERGGWPAFREQQTKVARRIKQYQELEVLGGELLYRAVDVADLVGLQNVVTEAETRWQEPLSGIIHLAGEGNLAHHWQVVDNHRILSETVEIFETMFQPKMYGTWALSQLVRQRPQALFLAFSSVNSLFGGSSFSAYSAASSFLDAYMQHLLDNYHAHTYCFDWSLWDNIGMSYDNPSFANDAARTQGYYTIAKDQALSSLLSALAHECHHLIVGLDGGNTHIQRTLKTASQPVQRLNAYFTGDPAPSRLQSLEVLDRFRTRSRCHFQSLTAFPLIADGEIDRRQLGMAVKSHDRATQANTVPTTAMEQIIATIWQKVLGLEKVGTYDNFFSLGGHSLRMSQVHSKLLAACKRDISMVDLFKYPTIHQLAQYLSQEEKHEEVFEKSHARADMRREMRRRRAQKRNRP